MTFSFQGEIKLQLSKDFTEKKFTVRAVIEYFISIKVFLKKKCAIDKAQFLKENPMRVMTTTNIILSAFLLFLVISNVILAV